MNLYLDSILFALIVLIYWVISEMFTILFRFAGLPDEKARFQVLSLLTGTGFTTHESEMILTTPRRRQLARITILFGYVFNLTIVTVIINAFLALRLSQAEHEFLAVLAPLGSVALIFAFIRSPKMRAWSDEKLEKLADTYFGRETGNTVMLLDYIGDNSIAQVRLKSVPEELRDKPLSASGLRESEGLTVLLIEHPGETPEPATTHILSIVFFYRGYIIRNPYRPIRAASAAAAEHIIRYASSVFPALRPAAEQQKIGGTKSDGTTKRRETQCDDPRCDLHRRQAQPDLPARGDRHRLFPVFKKLGLGRKRPDGLSARGLGHQRGTGPDGAAVHYIRLGQDHGRQRLL